MLISELPYTADLARRRLKRKLSSIDTIPETNKKEKTICQSRKEKLERGDVASLACVVSRGVFLPKHIDTSIRTVIPYLFPWLPTLRNIIQELVMLPGSAP